VFEVGSEDLSIGSFPDQLDLGQILEPFNVHARRDLQVETGCVGAFTSHDWLF
jgi:hypothetical protein